MVDHAHFMQRCLELASKGSGSAAPNPMVGCVIVHQGRIIGEGYHQTFGGPHAEVNAIESVGDPALLAKSTLYVTLEPCSHFGKTPPCSSLILNHKIPHVVIGIRDPFDGASGRGIELLQRGGVTVEEGVLEKECKWLNRRFLTFHQYKRPYIILKWAQTTDGFIDRERNSNDSAGPNWISSETARHMVHRLRAGESAVLVGTTTALVDNPRLTVRNWPGNSPLRLVIDKKLTLPKHLSLFDQSVPTIVFTEQSRKNHLNLEYVTLQFEENLPVQMLNELYQREILSLIVEGGSYTLNSFIEANLWDEAHIYTGNMHFGRGIPAPKLAGSLIQRDDYDGTLFEKYVNPAVNE